MDISVLSGRLNIFDKAVRAKAEELARQSRIRIRSLGEGEICRNVVCLHLSSIVCDQDEFPRELALKYSGTNDKVYSKTFQLVRNALGIATLDIKQLAVQFGCISLLPYATRILEKYKARHQELFGNLRNRAAKDEATPSIIAATLFLCGKRLKVKLDVKQLKAKCQATSKDWIQACNTIMEFCDEVLGPKPVPTKRISQKRKLEAETGGQQVCHTTDDLLEIAESPSGICARRTKRSKKRDGFQEEIRPDLAEKEDQNLKLMLNPSEERTIMDLFRQVSE